MPEANMVVMCPVRQAFRDRVLCLFHVEGRACEACAENRPLRITLIPGWLYEEIACPVLSALDRGTTPVHLDYPSFRGDLKSRAPDILAAKGTSMVKRRYCRESAPFEHCAQCVRSQKEEAQKRVSKEDTHAV